MGRDISTAVFTRADFQEFYHRLLAQRDLVAQWMSQSSGHAPWLSNPLDIGGETEYCAIRRSDGSAHHIAARVLGETPPPPWSYEVGAWNFEHGNDPQSMRGRPLTGMLQELNADQAAMDRVLAEHDGQLAAFGVLPSLTEDDLTHLIRTARFEALQRQFDVQHGDYSLDIGEGENRVQMSGQGIGLEAATTTHQLHISTSVSEAASLVNALRLAASVLIGLSGNSPFLFGKQVCRNESRLKVFFDSVRSRGRALGPSWMSRPLDQINEAIEVPALLPELSDQPDEKLLELTLQLGTYYAFVRLVLSHGLLRVEVRFMPCGPSNVDMMANNAATLALAHWLQPRMDWLIGRGLGFAVVDDNFRSAVYDGPDAPILWPNQRGKLRETTPAAVALQLQDNLYDTLVDDLDMEPDEATKHLTPFFSRAKSGQTGATWLIQAAERLPEENRMGRLTLAAAERANSGLPVVDWDLP
jgi:hypothetical protein